MTDDKSLQQVLRNIEKAMKIIEMEGIPQERISEVEDKIINLEKATNELSSLYKNNQ